MQQYCIVSIYSRYSKQIHSFLQGKFDEMQRSSGLQILKLIQEIETRWNSTYLMLDRLVERKECVAATLAVSPSEIQFFNPQEISAIKDCLTILKPFNDATTELSAEQSVCGSKVVPLMNMLLLSVDNSFKTITAEEPRKVGEYLSFQLREKLNLLQSASVNSLASLLDPRYKALSFFSPNKLN